MIWNENKCKGSRAKEFSAFKKCKLQNQANICVKIISWLKELCNLIDVEFEIVCDLKELCKYVTSIYNFYYII